MCSREPKSTNRFMQHRKKVTAQKLRYLKINNLFDKWLQKTQRGIILCSWSSSQAQYRHADTTRCKAPKTAHLKINNLCNKEQNKNCNGVLKTIKPKKQLTLFSCSVRIGFSMVTETQSQAGLGCIWIISNQWDQKWGRKPEERVDVSASRQHMTKHTETLPILTWSGHKAPNGNCWTHAFVRNKGEAKLWCNRTRAGSGVKVKGHRVVRKRPYEAFTH